VENRKIRKATLLIATVVLSIVVLAVPFAPRAFGTDTPALSITSSSPSADFGGTFTASVNMTGANNVAAYDLRVTYNPDVLTATSATVQGTLFANGFISRASIIPALGLVRYLVALEGGITANSPGGLLSITFKVNDPASTPAATASEYPSTISIGSRSQIIENNGGVFSVCGQPFASDGSPNACPTITLTSATYMPPADVGLRDFGCKGQSNGWNTKQKGFTIPILCRIVNNGSGTISAHVDINYQSSTISGSLSGPTATLGPAGVGVSNSALTVPAHTIDIFTITGAATRTITFQDGSVLAIPNTTPYNGITGGTVTWLLDVH